MDLPDTFSIREAFDILGWQGSRKGLARHLQAEGFTSTLVGDAKSARMMWRHPAPFMLMESCPCRCHTGTCGANDMDLAERSLVLVERLRLNDAHTITALYDLVHRAGVNYAQAALKRVALNDDVPF